MDPLSEAQGELVTDHDNALHVTINVAFSEKVAGVHIAEMHFVRDIVQQFVDNTEVSFPAGFIVEAE